MEPEFKDSVSLPVKDLDLFNAIMLGMYKLYGMEGIKRLGKNLLEGMHPAQMVKGIKAKAGSAFFRVYSGTLKSGSYVYNSTKGKKERIGRQIGRASCRERV